MKKIMLAIAIALLLICMPLTISVSTPKINLEKTKITILKDISSSELERPLWAQGYFNGTWAYDFLGAGIPWPPLGNLSGYYSIGYHWDIRMGHFLVDFSLYNGDDAARVEGWFFGPFLGGEFWQTNDDANKTVFVGVGNYNETSTEFSWRLMAFRGPTFYMWGNSTRFY